jgi:hypothetical protein
MSNIWEDIGPWVETDNPHRVKVTAKYTSACNPYRGTYIVELNWHSILYALTQFVNSSDPKYWTQDAVNLLRAEAQKIEDAIAMRNQP